jgi:hypothetical protein
LLTATRVVVALAAALTVAGVLGAPEAAPGTSPVTNAKHFFWAPGQDPQGTVASVQNDIIYHGGNAGPGAIGIQKKPAVYLIYWAPSGLRASRPRTRTASSSRARRSRTT